MNMNAVNVGMNKYCGPAVLSILTGKNTDECARVISRINGQYEVVGVNLDHLLIAANRLGFNNLMITPAGSLYGTLARLAVRGDGVYILTLPNHFVVIEVKEKKVYFCDNHTKEPMPATASARLLQRVVAVNQVIKRPETVIEPVVPKPEPDYRQERINQLKERIAFKRAEIARFVAEIEVDQTELTILAEGF
jgi:hypothetical protein